MSFNNSVFTWLTKVFRFSPFVEQNEQGNGIPPPPPTYFLIKQDGTFVIKEDGTTSVIVHGPQ